MATSQFILFAGGTQWKIAVGEEGGTRWQDLLEDETLSAAVRADQAAVALQGFGYRGEPLLIALAGSRCLSSTLWIDGLPKNDFKARLYRLETQLPMDAEQVVADFGPVGSVDGREYVLAVCTDRAWLAELIGELESRKVAVGPVVPAALLAAQGEYSTKPPDEMLLLGEPGELGDHAQTLNLLEFRAGRPLTWVSLTPNVGDVRTHLEWQSLQAHSPQRIDLVGVDGALTKQISQLNGWKLHPKPGLPADRAIVAAADILAARRKPLINLRRGPLAVGDRWRSQRKAINAVLATIVVFLIISSVVLSYRSWRYSQIADSDQRLGVEMFHQTFPGWATPVNVRAIVESEHRKSFDASMVNGQVGSALTTLNTVLGHIPATSDISVQRMTFSPQRFDLTGELKNYEAADELASSLRGNGFDISPPEARRQPDGRWSFVIQGNAAPSPGAVR